MIITPGVNFGPGIEIGGGINVDNSAIVLYFVTEQTQSNFVNETGTANFVDELSN